MIKRLPKNFFRAIMCARCARLEVYFQTGKRLSEIQPNRERAARICRKNSEFSRSIRRVMCFIKRIKRRAELHFENGLVEEVKQLARKRRARRHDALGAHGYRRVCEYLRGERTLESAIEQTKQDVRNYAKRQMSWFRREEDVDLARRFRR